MFLETVYTVHYSVTVFQYQVCEINTFITMLYRKCIKMPIRHAL